MHEGDVHFRRHQGGGELQIGGEDVALAVGVGVFGRVDQVAVGGARLVRVADRAVDAAVAIVQLGFGARLDAGGHADGAAGQGEEVRTRDLEVPQAQLGLGLADHVDADGVQRRLVGRGGVAKAWIGRVAAVEEVVGVGRRLGRPFGQPGRGDVVGHVLGCGLGPEQGGLPVPAAPFAAQAAEGAILLVRHLDIDRAHVVETIAGQADVLSERIVVVGSGDGHGDRRQGVDRRLTRIGLRIIGPQFAEGLDRIIDLIATRQEEVETIDLGHDGQVFLGRVRQQGGVDIGRLLQAQAVSQGGGASGQGVRLDGEGGEALSAIGGGAGQGELAPGRQ
ncbi:hypothetical protein D3C80_999440 [compost metagenome]